MELQIYNTLARKREGFVPLEEGKVRFYVCGPTVYDYIHLGNARIFIIFDVFRRYLEKCGYQVIYVQNFTDIEDKMIHRAEELGITVKELAERFIDAYLEDASSLRIKKATYHPRAAEHVQEIIKLIEALLEKGMAYQSGRDVLFSTQNFPDYGKLSQQKKEELVAGARVEVDENKQHPLDFVLWKGEKPGEPAWDSPWGRGRPGWHIECSAMAMCYLGDTVDIHAGGPDLAFPHHENEIAQSEACTGHTFVRYWMHSGYLNINKEKMSKSLGNVLTVRELLKQYQPLDLRFLILSAHYRSPLNFDEEQMQKAISGRRRLQNSLDNLRSAFLRAKDKEQEEAERRLEEELSRAKKDFEAAMKDDFNTAEAFSALFNLSREVNNYLHQPELQRSLLRLAWDFYRECNEVLEILDLPEGSPEEEELDEKVRQAIEERERARQEKNFATADRIRDELKNQGILLEDTPHGVRWKRIQ